MNFIELLRQGIMMHVDSFMRYFNLKKETPPLPLPEETRSQKAIKFYERVIEKDKAGKLNHLRRCYIVIRTIYPNAEVMHRDLREIWFAMEFGKNYTGTLVRAKGVTPVSDFFMSGSTYIDLSTFGTIAYSAAKILDWIENCPPGVDLDHHEQLSSKLQDIVENLISIAEALDYVV